MFSFTKCTPHFTQGHGFLNGKLRKYKKVQRQFYTGQQNIIQRGTLGFAVLRYCGVRQFFLGYFGNFNLELRYSGFLQTCRMRFFGILDGIKKFSLKSSVRAFSSFRSFSDRFGSYLFCLFCLNLTFPNVNVCSRVICSKLNVQCSGFSMTLSFDTV